MLIRLGVGVFFAMYVMLFSIPTYLPFLPSLGTGGFESLQFPVRWLLLALSTPVLLILGLPILSQSLHQLSRLTLNVDVLIALGTFAAYGLSVYNTLRGAPHVYFDTATMLLVLVTVGRYLEARSKASTSDALDRLMDGMPKTAVVLRNQKEVRIPTNEIEVEDRVKILPGDVFPVDGVIEKGTGAVDESSLTGESDPVFKEHGSRVSSGTFSLDGSFVTRAIRVPAESTSARIARLLEQAQQSSAPVQRVADRIVSFFVPAVVLLASAVFVYWTSQEGVEKALLTSLSVLVVSCPCALGIATPIALWVALGETAKRGLLLRGGEALEALTKVRTVFFDKTGTLTSGTLTFSEALVVPDVDVPQDVLMNRIAALMENSSHPIARSFQKAMGRPDHLPPVQDFRNYPGLGIAGKVGGKDQPVVYIGSWSFMQRMSQIVDAKTEADLKERESSGDTVVLVGWCGRVRAILCFRESLRPEAASVVAALRKVGLRVGILTGDRKPLARLMGNRLGDVDFHIGLSPDDKVHAIRERRRQTSAVAMVGDGINDAPALAAADVGIAVGTGADLTREAADVNLVTNDLSKITWLIAYARRVKRKIVSNLFWAFFYNVIAIGFAATGRLNPLIAAIAMILSSLFVVGNSQRIRSTEGRHA